MKKEYVIEIKPEDQIQRKNLEKFLLNNSNEVRFTRVTWGKGCSPLAWFKINSSGGSEKDVRFQKVLSNLKSDFIKTEISDSRFNNRKQPAGEQSTHDFYKMSTKVKDILSKETLNFKFFESADLYGYEDPAFYCNDEMLGVFISNENICVLTLTDKERKQLEKLGIVLSELPNN
jgi:hypothetical protein